MKILTWFKNNFINIFILSILINHCAFADDTEFGGLGAAPMPIEQASVKMLAEKIVITGVNINNLQGYWQYN